MNKKWILIPTAAVVVGAGALMMTTASASAQEDSMEGAPHQRMIQLIAEKFGKSEDEVRAVFEEIHAEHEVQRLAALETKLSEAVAAGTITEQQKQLILEKFESLKVQRQERRVENQTKRKEFKAEMKAERKSQRAEFEAWAEANGIDLEFLQSLHEGGPGAGQHLRGRFAG